MHEYLKLFVAILKTIICIFLQRLIKKVHIILRTIFFKSNLRSCFIALIQSLKYLTFLQKIYKNSINCYCFKIIIKRLFRTNKLIIVSKIDLSSI